MSATEAVQFSCFNRFNSFSEDITIGSMIVARLRREFEYARGAIVHGATDRPYLDMEELRRA